MNYRYQPKTKYEKFGLQVYNALAESFPQTYFVGGMVRDMLLRRKIYDIDITTDALPREVETVLQASGIATDLSHVRYGLVSAWAGGQAGDKIEITTFRRDLPAPSRYPKVRFVKTAKADSRRRDFTVNGLYYKRKAGTIYDFYGGLTDLKKRQLKFIGLPTKRIAEDPLRIIRALRFQVQLNFQLEHRTAAAIKKYFPSVSKLSQSKIKKEIRKLPTTEQQNRLRKIINSYPLDA